MTAHRGVPPPITGKTVQPVGWKSKRVLGAFPANWSRKRTLPVRTGDLVLVPDSSGFPECFQDPPAAVFQQADHMIETALAAIIGIRHPGIIVIATKADEGTDLRVMCSGWIEPLDVFEIRLVHGDDEIETPQVRGKDLPCTAMDRVAESREGIGHPGVRTRPFVMADGSSGIDFKFGLPCIIRDEFAKNDLGGG